MKKKKIYIIAILSVILIILPFIMWQIKPYSKINVWIIDKTVPNNDYREHKGLFWILNNMKVINKISNDKFDYKEDYFGFKPKSNGFQISEISVNNPNLIYIADCYGVYKDDFNQNNMFGTRSQLIFGGLKPEEVFKIKKYLNKKRTIIAEFNTIEYPTDSSVRSDIENIFGFKWTGWIGRYFSELKKGYEVPSWLITNYERQNNVKWDFNGYGIVFIKEDDTIVVLDKNDIGKSKIKIDFFDKYKPLYNVKDNCNFYYWFEIVTKRDSEVIANYKLDLSKSGISKIVKSKIPISFPAILRKNNDDYISYYFAGDFVDIKEIPEIYKLWGYDIFKKIIVQNDHSTNNYFYWNVYTPMMKKIINDSLEFAKLQNEQVKSDNIYKTTDNINLISRIQKNYFQIFNNNKWENFYIKGINIGLAIPGKWFTEMPENMADYLRWFKMISDMNINTIRVYTLCNPTFYKALKIYNETYPEKKLYLIQEIWPDENPKDQNYLDKANLDSFISEIGYVVDAIHGNIEIKKRTAKSYGVFDADVSKWTIAFLVGRELEPDEVINTNKLNRGFHYVGDYLKNTKGNATEAWLSLCCDYLLKYETEKYRMQHPVAIVSWPTLDPISHNSEFNKEKKKELEYNDKTSIDINTFDLCKKNYAGFFGAYHIYPNYPDFMNNEEKYKEYKDQYGRFMYGGYLKEFISTQKKYPALVAEFGLATGMANIHSNPDGYNHGGVNETLQGNGIVRMMNAIRNEGYIGGIIFEWMDEWAKKSWFTEPFMIPYERHILWHNMLDPEQNYGILANESITPKKPQLVINDDGIVKNIEISSDQSYLYINLVYDKNIDLNKDEIIIGIDTYDRNRGDFKFKSNINIFAPSGIEFVILIRNKQAKILAHPNYNIGKMKFASKKTFDGIYTEINPIINKERITTDGRTIPEIRQDGSTLFFGDFSDSHNNFNIIKDKIYLRIPWGKLNITDPSSHMVLDDNRYFLSYASRDTFIVTKTDGIVISGVILENERVVDIFPGKNKIEKIIYKWDEWSEVTYKERLKKSYYILKDAFLKIK